MNKLALSKQWRLIWEYHFENLLISLEDNHHLHVFKLLSWFKSSLVPGPAQLSVACSIEKQRESDIFSHVSMI